MKKKIITPNKFIKLLSHEKINKWFLFFTFSCGFIYLIVLLIFIFLLDQPLIVPITHKLTEPGLVFVVLGVLELVFLAFSSLVNVFSQKKERVEKKLETIEFSKIRGSSAYKKTLISEKLMAGFNVKTNKYKFLLYTFLSGMGITCGGILLGYVYSCAGAKPIPDYFFARNGNKITGLNTAEDSNIKQDLKKYGIFQVPEWCDGFEISEEQGGSLAGMLPSNIRRLEFFPKKTAAMTTIPSNAFEKCSMFQGSVFIPGYVTSIGDHAFDGCTNIDGIMFSFSSKESASQLTTIGEFAFSGCAMAKSANTQDLVFPASIVTIGEGAFYKYGYGETKEIGKIEFLNCLKLVSIGSNAFQDCYSGITYDIFFRNLPWSQIQNDETTTLPTDIFGTSPTRPTIRNFHISQSWDTHLTPADSSIGGYFNNIDWNITTPIYDV